MLRSDSASTNAVLHEKSARNPGKSALKSTAVIYVCSESDNFD
jgi:hypothetical protein